MAALSRSSAEAEAGGRLASGGRGRHVPLLAASGGGLVAIVVTKFPHDVSKCCPLSAYTVVIAWPCLVFVGVIGLALLASACGGFHFARGSSSRELSVGRVAEAAVAPCVVNISESKCCELLYLSELRVVLCKFSGSLHTNSNAQKNQRKASQCFASSSRDQQLGDLTQEIKLEQIHPQSSSSHIRSSAIRSHKRIWMKDLKNSTISSVCLNFEFFLALHFYNSSSNIFVLVVSTLDQGRSTLVPDSRRPSCQTGTAVSTLDQGRSTLVPDSRSPSCQTGTAGRH
ncbi:hypothetical protein Taro_007846 [Colocasia esculenta]|uniref:Uncharacterized protein n=1 Tax=Colocasia esculenta TaxID=4460 RepID=A0A843U064_COLES|nr:hypothetical protein [Colocasia esculenta]